MLRIFVLALAAAIYAAPACAAGNAPIVLFVHAWIPELGPIENPTTDTENRLFKMANLARYGDFTAANNLANAMLAAHPDPRIRYLVLMFRHQLARRFVRLPGGSSMTLSDDLTLVRMIHSAQDHADVSEATLLASNLGKPDADQLAAIRQVETIMNDCLDDRFPPRYGAIPSSMAAQINKITKDWDASCKKHVSDFLEPGVSMLQFAADRELLSLLIDSYLAILSRDDMATAKSDVQRGLELVRSKHWSGTEALWLLREGDIEAAPRGSVLSLGYELAAENNIRSDLSNGHLTVAQTYDRHHGSPQEAARYYDEAEHKAAANSTIRPSDIAIRRAMLRFLERQPAGAAYRRAADLARSEDSPWNETMARTCAGLLSDIPGEFVAAVESAENATLPGAEFSMGQLAMSWNVRAVREGDSARAIEELGAMTDALAGHGFQISDAEMMMMRSSLEDNLGRNDASIDSLYKAITAEKDFLITAHGKQALAPRPPVLGEVVTETATRMNLLRHLFELKTHLEMRELDEGMIVYAERRATIEKELAEFSASMEKEWPQGAANFEMLEKVLETKIKNDDLKQRSAQVDRFMRAENCDQILRTFNTTRSDLEHAASPVLILQGLTIAGFCDPALREQARIRLSDMHPVENIQAALTQAPDPFTLQRTLLVRSAVGDASALCYLADRAEAGELLGQWIDGLDRVLAGMNLSELPPQERTYFRARSLAIRGDFLSAKRALVSIESDEPFWTYQASRDLRQNVLEARVEAEVHSGSAEAALLASERARADREHADEVASGVTLSDPNSAEAAMLLRRAAVDGDVDQQRLAELQSSAKAAGYQFRLPGMDDLRAGINSLPAGVTALVFHPLTNELAVWRIDAGGKPRLIQAPVRSNDLVRLAGELRGRLAGSEAGWQAPAEELYKYLIAPAGPIPPGQTIAIFGIERLGGIPLEVLRDSQGYSLLVRNPLVYVSALADTRRWPALQQSRTKSLVAGINAGGLTAPEDEATVVASRLGTVGLTGSSVTVARISEALPQARFVHLATHGVLDAKNPYRSYLAMADGRLETWVLLRDIAGVDLIVLSACDTKLGPRAYMKRTSSDESSITGFILRAGARRIVSSLWGATDSATESLMKTFYSELHRNPHDPARALQSAKLQLSTPGSHPYTFANFVLSVQNPQTIRLH